MALRQIGEISADPSHPEDWVPLMNSSNSKAQVASDMLRGI
jgi:hypothetical protein